MTLRPVQPTPPEDDDDSVTVDVAARRLGCDGSTVRALLRARKLRGHKVGKGDKPGGVRISLASIRAYKARNAIGGEEPAQDAPERPQERNPAHKEAMALLRALGAV